MAARCKLLTSDAAVLETEDTKKDLPCTVTQIKPILGFDLRFHTGYDITVPLHELEGDGNQLTILFKVTSDAAKDSPIYFSQRYRCPKIDADARGDAYLQGGFDVGEGGYHVSWMMRDRHGAGVLVELGCHGGADVEGTKHRS